MSNGPSATQSVTDALQIVNDVISGKPADALPAAKDLLEQALLLLPPIDASSLDPADRAAADAAAQAAEDAKFPPKGS